MVLVHNMMLRGLNSIYLQAKHITKADERPFCKYILTWHLLLDHHHSGEEADLFPAIDQMVGEKDVMAVNVEQHHAFHPDLDAFITYVKDCETGKQKYDGDRIVALIDAFGKTLSDHLAEEISTITDLKRFGEKVDSFPKVMDHEGEKVMVSGSRPHSLSNHGPTDPWR
jgi:Hemerythrin HHE cation binding domain